jgi:hypothetical protein
MLRVLSLSIEKEYFCPAVLVAMLDDNEAAFLQAFMGKCAASVREA